MNFTSSSTLFILFGFWKGVGCVPVPFDLSAVESLVNGGGMLDNVLGGGGGSAGGGGSGFDINSMVSMVKGITAADGGGESSVGSGGGDGIDIGSMIQAGIPLLQGFLSNM